MKHFGKAIDGPMMHEQFSLEWRLHDHMQGLSDIMEARKEQGLPTVMSEEDTLNLIWVDDIIKAALRTRPRGFGEERSRLFRVTRSQLSGSANLAIGCGWGDSFRNRPIDRLPGAESQEAPPDHLMEAGNIVLDALHQPRDPYG